MVNILNETRRAALLQAVTADPTVAAVAASSPRTPAVVETPVAAETTADRSADTSSRLPIGQIAVSPEYFDVLDIAVVRGRGFTPTERTAEAGVAIVTDTVARRLWPTRDAVGQVVRLQAQKSESPAARSLSSAEARSADGRRVRS